MAQVNAIPPKNCLSVNSNTQSPYGRFHPIVSSDCQQVLFELLLRFVLFWAAKKLKLKKSKIIKKAAFSETKQRNCLFF